MKIRDLLSFAVALFALCVHASLYNKEVWQALNQGADVDVIFRVVDDAGTPVVNAICSGWLYQEGVKNQGSGHSGNTDTNGCYRVKGRCGEWFSLVVRKEGYYNSMVTTKYPTAAVESAVHDGKWQPYGEVRNVVLKKIKAPWSVNVFRETSHRHSIPAWETWIGFDLEMGDWTSPYGKGRFTDVELRFKADVRKPRIDFTYTMEVSFSRIPFGGAYVMKKDTCSDLHTEYVADTNRNFSAGFVFATECVENHRPKTTSLDSDSYLVFRTRTRVDSEGRLIGAHYGKISGLWRSTDRIMQLGDGCFNPNENDPNIEGDMVLHSVIRNYERRMRRNMLGMPAR